jgi:membrane protein
LLLVILSIVGRLLGHNTAALKTVRESVQRHLPVEVHELIRTTLVSLNENSVGAGIIGYSLLLFAASVVFGVLRSSVNRIWRSPSRVTEAGSPVKMAFFFIFNKLLAFLLVIGTAFILLAALISNIVIQIILILAENFQEIVAFIKVDELQLARWLEIGSSFLVLALVAAILLKVLPSVRVCWQDIWLSALLISALMVILQQLVSNSVISIGSQFLSYGVIGSVMVLMLWIFFTFQIFLFGCVMSYIYAHMFGSYRHREMSQLDGAQS